MPISYRLNSPSPESVTADDWAVAEGCCYLGNSDSSLTTVSSPTIIRRMNGPASWPCSTHEASRTEQSSKAAFGMEPTGEGEPRYTSHSNVELECWNAGGNGILPARRVGMKICLRRRIERKRFCLSVVSLSTVHASSPRSSVPSRPTFAVPRSTHLCHHAMSHSK